MFSGKDKKGDKPGKDKDKGKDPKKDSKDKKVHESDTEDSSSGM